jgi:hypothetical protein
LRRLINRLKPRPRLGVSAGEAAAVEIDQQKTPTRI